VVSWLAFAGMILVTSAGLFGAYAVGFYDGVKDGERLARTVSDLQVVLRRRPDDAVCTPLCACTGVPSS
jgi:hypothetical protein